jgi:ribonuclease P protein component
MPPKTERLTKYDFSGLKKRTTLVSSLFDIVYTPSPTLKIACVTAKKRVKKAVDRNKIKRKIYHAFRETKPKNPYIFIFYPKIESLHAPYTKLVEEMKRLFATLQ